MPVSNFIQPAQYAKEVPREQEQPRNFTTASPSAPTRTVSNLCHRRRKCTQQDSLAFGGNIQSVMSYPQMDTPRRLTPSNPHQHITSTPTTQQQSPPQQQDKPQPPSCHLNPSSSSSRLTARTYKRSFSGSLL